MSSTPRHGNALLNRPVVGSLEEFLENAGDHRIVGLGQCLLDFTRGVWVEYERLNGVCNCFAGGVTLGCRLLEYPLAADGDGK